LSEDIYDVELFKGLNNMMAGGGFFTVPDSPLPKESQTNKRIGKLSIRFTVISWEAPRKPTRCISCRSTRDQRRRDFQAWKSSKAKMDYLETQKELLLVSKIVDKMRNLAQVEEESGSRRWRTKHKTAGTALFADLGTVHNPNGISIHHRVNTDNNRKTVNDMYHRWYVEVLLLLAELVIDPKASPDLKNAANNLCNTDY
jgi:hypothetical protein